MPRTKTAAASKKIAAEPVKTVTPPPAPTVEVQTGGGKPQQRKRTFKIKLTDTEFCSRITGFTPKQAASKALTLLMNMRLKSPSKMHVGVRQQGGKVVFTIKETTRGSKGKEYVYQGEKVKLKQPTTYQIRSPTGEVKEIVNRFRNVIEKYQEKA